MNIKRIKVRTIWQGKVAIRDKQLNEAKEKRQTLWFVHKDDKMIIYPADIDGRIVARSETTFFDKFGGGQHYLIYFDWKPIKNKQKELL